MPRNLPEGRERSGHGCAPDGNRVQERTLKNSAVNTDYLLNSSRTGAVTASPPCKAVNANMLRMAGSFTGHDRTQTQTQASIALGSGQKAGAGMGAIPTEPEM